MPCWGHHASHLFLLLNLICHVPLQAAQEGLVCSDVLGDQCGPDFELFIKSGVAAFGVQLTPAAWELAHADTAAGDDRAVVAAAAAAATAAAAAQNALAAAASTGGAGGGGCRAVGLSVSCRKG
jgi:hypothetical protein